MKTPLRLAVALLALAWSPMLRAEVYLLQVAGLACPLCAHSVKKRLGELDGVQEVQANYKDGEVVVRTRDGATLTEAQARKAIEGAGFKLTRYREVAEEGPR